MAKQVANGTDTPRAMISSTTIDLPEHRDLVKDVCLRQAIFPIMMEHLPATDDAAIAESLRMVNEADIYLGIFAYRYGYIPQGYDISVAEMEYNRAVERDIPRLIFLIDKDHPLKSADVETGAGAVKIEALKMRLKVERNVEFFKSPAELRDEVYSSLALYRQTLPVPPEYYTCFISYSSKDESFAKRLHSDLQSKGVTCWFAPEDMKIGEKIRSSIDEAIQTHDKLLIVLSEHSVESDWVEKEVETAFEKETQQKKAVLFPVRLDEMVMLTKQTWAADIRRTRHIGDFSNWKEQVDYQKAFNRLLRDLKVEPPRRL